MVEKLFASVRLAFQAPAPRSSESQEEIKGRIARRTVARVATGNVRLQRGEYVTSKDLDSQYERVKAYKFEAP